MAISQIKIPSEKIQLFCKSHHIQKLALFGSVLRDDFKPESDIDILVKFHPEHIPGWEIVSIEDELSRILGRKVDLRTEDEISETFRNDVISQSVTVYE